MQQKMRCGRQPQVATGARPVAGHARDVQPRPRRRTISVVGPAWFIE